MAEILGYSGRTTIQTPTGNESKPEAQEKAKDPYWVDALSQGLAVLQAFDTDRSSLTLTEIASRLGWSRSKPYRFVHTLEKLGYLGRDESGRGYRLTTKSMQLGFAYLIRLPLVELAQPILDGLRNTIQSSTHLAVQEDNDLVYLALSRLQRPTAINIHVGSRMPLYASSIGRLLLAYKSHEEVDRILGDGPIPSMTPKSTADPHLFRLKLAQAKQDGYILNDEEFSLGIRSLAAPVFDRTGAVVAGINATALTTNFGDQRLHQEVIPAVVQAATELSQGLNRVEAGSTR